MDDQSDIQTVIGRRGLVFVYAYLERRVAVAIKKAKAIPKSDPKYNPKAVAQAKRLGTIIPNGLLVLKHKLDAVSESHELEIHEGPDSVVENVSYCMASLAGEPGKEILAEGSTGAAAYLSWHLLCYLGWECKLKPTNRAKGVYGAWLDLIVAMPASTGVCQKYNQQLIKHWEPTGQSDDSELTEIASVFGDKKWFTRYGAALVSND